MGIYLIVGVIVLVIYLSYYRRKKRAELLKKLNDSFGKKPKKYNEDFDMSFVKHYYEMRKKQEGDNESIDELTWNDLDLDDVFKRINYTKTTLGESYLYYKLREVSYDKNDWNDMEELIDILMNNESLRNEVSLNLIKVGKLNDNSLTNFIYKPEFSKIKGYYKYPILAIAFILSIILSFINTKIGMPLLILFFCTNILFYQSAKIYLEENFNTMIYLYKNIIMCQSLCKIKDKSFSKFNNQIKDILKKCNGLKRVNKYGSTLGKSRNLLSDADLLLEYFKMFFMLDIIAYQNITKILDKNKENFYEIYDLIAKLDFALSIAFFRKSVEEYVKPEFTDNDNIEFENIYHPLVDNPVKNSILIKNNIIFTGSNASGKSTFIKAIAVNCIMAQSLNTALCSKYKCRLSKVVTSMAIRDNIVAGDSYFISEIKSLKRLLDSLNSSIPVFAFIDEILKGTNTIERISASASILKYTKNTNSRILVATHDIELTEMLDEGYDNYHFRETVTDDEVLFDYKLKEGPSKTRNAIKLLKVMDFEPKVVNLANEVYTSFVENKKWSKV